MGLTISDRIKIKYNEMKSHGIAHDDILKAMSYPNDYIEQCLKMSFIESHFGIKNPITLATIVVVAIIGAIVWTLLAIVFLL